MSFDQQCVDKNVLQSALLFSVMKGTFITDTQGSFAENPVFRS
jgi:hypothetical protein